MTAAAKQHVSAQYRGAVSGSAAPGRVASGRVIAPRLVGRDRELGLLADTLAAPPAVAIIEGEAGIGKSRLVSELADLPELIGPLRLVGGCRRIREPFLLGPVIEAVRGLGGDHLRAVRLSPVVGALRPLLPELARWLPPLPEPLDDRTAERHRVFRGLTELLASVGPVVLVLEDLHWADEQTAEFLAYLLGDPPQRLSVVLTYRGEEIDAGVRASLAKLPAAVNRAHMVLEPLDVEQTGSLAASILGTDRVSTDFAAHLCSRASGVPFAIEELLALLRARGTLVRRDGRWGRKALDELDVPAGIRDPVLERLGRLPEEARVVVQAAAVLQEPIPASVLVTVCRADKSSAYRGLEQALASGLLIECGETVGFRHELAAQAVYEELAGPHVRDLHRRAAAALETLDPVPLGSLTHHLRHSGRLQEWAVVAERAADQAMELGHDAEVVRLLDDVLNHASVEPEQRGRLALKLGRAAHETLQSSQRLIDLLSDVLEQDLPPAVRGELAFWLSTAVQDAGGDPALMRRLLLEAVERLADRPDLHAWAMVGLGIATHPGVPLAEHKRWLDRVLEILPKVDDPAFEVFLLGKAAMTLIMVGDPGWGALVQRIEDQTGGAPRHRREVNAYMSAGITACYTARYSTAGRLLSRALDEATACESRPLEAMIRSTQALLDCCRGRWDGLGNRIDVLLDELADVPVARVDVEVAGGTLALAHGDLGHARHRLTRVAQQLEATGDVDLLALALGTLARLAVTSGDVDDIEDAVARVDRLLAALESTDLWAPFARALPAAAEVLIVAGRLPDARALIDRCGREWADLDVPLAPAALCQSQGVLAVAEHRWTDAAEHLLAAAELYDSLGCLYEAAQVYEQAAVALMEVGDQRAEQILRTALAAYEGLGARWDAARCTRTARAHGLRVPVSYRGGRVGYGDELSPREQEVARLAAQGMSNKEIGDVLFLSPKTVDKHLGRAMRKLGVHSRAAVAARLAHPPPLPG